MSGEEKSIEWMSGEGGAETLRELSRGAIRCYRERKKGDLKELPYWHTQGVSSGKTEIFGEWENGIK